MTHSLTVHSLNLASIESADMFDLKFSKAAFPYQKHMNPLTAFPSAFYSCLVLFCPLQLWLALYNFTGLCVKEFLFIVGFVMTVVVRYTFTGTGVAEQKEEGGKQMTK